MERKKSALSGFFNAVNALENILLTLMVVGMIVTILLQIGGGQRRQAVICSCG